MTYLQKPHRMNQMSLLDSVFQEHPCSISLRISTSLPLPCIHQKELSIQRKGIWTYDVHFQHEAYDLVGLLQQLHMIRDDSSIDNVSYSCDCPDVLGFRFTKHFFRLLASPSRVPRTSSLRYSNHVVPRSCLPPDCHVPTCICAAQILAYHLMTNCSFCKIQILTYLPWITGRNKFFPDVLCIETPNGVSLQDIMTALKNQRHTRQQLYSMYQKYNLFSNFSVSSLSSFQPTFDICYSNFPEPLFFYHAEFTKKSLQSESSYLQTFQNHKQDVCFLFAHDSDLKTLPSLMISMLKGNCFLKN